MKNRVIIGGMRTGTISRTEARAAARAAKTGKISKPLTFGRGATGRKVSSGGSSGADASGGDSSHGSSYFKFLFEPATAEPKGWASKVTKTSTKKHGGGSAKRSGSSATKPASVKKAANKKPGKAAKSSR